jgi:hypothetical protein
MPQDEIKKATTLYSSSYDSTTGKTSYTSSSNPLYDAKISGAKSVTNTSPVATVPSVLSTENAANNVQKDVGNLNNISPTTAPGYVAPKVTTTTPAVEPKAYFINDNGQEIQFTQSQYSDPTNQKFLQDNGYVQSKAEFNTDYVSNKDTMTDEVSSYNTALEELTKNMTDYNVDTDPEYIAKVNSIKSQFSTLIDQAKKTNAGRMGSLTSLGLRLGTTQYAGVTQTGITGEEFTQANQRIATLNQQEADAISSARSAFQSGKWEEFNNQMSAVTKVRDAKAKELDDYNTKLATSINKIQDAQIQSSRDDAIGSLLTQGVTDVATMLDYLNYDDKGNKVGDFTSKEVADTMKNFATDIGVGSLDKLTGETKNFSILKDSGLLPKSITSLPADQQLGAFLKWNTSMTSSKAVQDAGNTGTGSFDQFSKEQIALSAIPTQLRNSDTELKRYLDGIRSGLAEGKTPYEVADNLMGYKIEKPDDFSNSVRGYISVANLNSSEIGNVARLINSGNKTGAIQVIENKVLDTQKKLDPESYVGEATPRYYVDKVAQIKKTIEDAGLLDQIGPIEGTIQNVLGKLSSRDAMKIKAQVTSLVAEMRNHLSGTAVTESEKQFLEPLISSLSDKKGVFLNKLDEISTNSLTKYNETRKSAGLPALNESELLNKDARADLYANGVSDPNNPIDKKVNDPLEVGEVNTISQNNPMGI